MGVFNAEDAERPLRVQQDTETLVLRLTEIKENRLEDKAMVDQMARRLEACGGGGGG